MRIILVFCMFLTWANSVWAEHDSGDRSGYAPDSHPSAPPAPPVSADIQRRTADLTDVQEEEAKLQEAKDIEDMARLKEAIDNQLMQINSPDAIEAAGPAAVGEATTPRMPILNSFLRGKR